MQTRRAFTIIEVTVSILIFAVGGLGLAASAAAIARQVSASSLRSDAAALARTRAETAHSLGCAAPGTGEDRAPGIHSVWSVGGFSMEQTIERTDAFGLHRDRFLSAVPCG